MHNNEGITKFCTKHVPYVYRLKIKQKKGKNKEKLDRNMSGYSFISVQNFFSIVKQFPKIKEKQLFSWILF